MDTNKHITNTFQSLKTRIKKNEGYSNKPYKDQLGYGTIGYGHLIKPHELKYFKNQNFQNQLLLKVGLIVQYFSKKKK